MNKFMYFVASFLLVLGLAKAKIELDFMTDEEFHAENEELREMVSRYKAFLELGMVESEAQTADIHKIELSLTSILAERSLAKKDGETFDAKRKRMTKELRFRNRLLRDAGIPLQAFDDSGATIPADELFRK